MLDSARVRALELRQPLDVWYVRHVEVAARHDDGIEALLPPLVLGSVLALLSQYQAPLRADLFSQLNAGVVAYEPLVPIAPHQRLDVPADHGVAAERCVGAVLGDGELAALRGNWLCREAHGQAVDVGLEVRVH